MEIAEATLRPRGLVRVIDELIARWRELLRVVNEAEEIVESRIRRLVSQGGQALVKIINEVLQPNWSWGIIRVVGDTIQFAESRIRVMAEGTIFDIIRVANDTLRLIEGPFGSHNSLWRVIDEQVAVVESTLGGIALGLIEIVGDVVSAVDSAISRLGYQVLKIVGDVVAAVEAGGESVWMRMRRTYVGRRVMAAARRLRMTRRG